MIQGGAPQTVMLVSFPSSFEEKTFLNHDENPRLSTQ